MGEPYFSLTDVTRPTRNLPYRIDENTNRRFSVVLQGAPFGTCDRKTDRLTSRQG